VEEGEIWRRGGGDVKGRARGVVRVQPIGLRISFVGSVAAGRLYARADSFLQHSAGKAAFLTSERTPGTSDE
jgi:hypothetical protein